MAINLFTSFAREDIEQLESFGHSDILFFADTTL